MNSLVVYSFSVFISLLLSVEIHAKCVLPKRDMHERYLFMKSTGYPKGRKGYIVDHITPLCAGGADKVSNMQWQTIQEAREKDIKERAFCHSLWSN